MRKYLILKLKCVISVTWVQQVTSFDNLTETQCLYFVGNEFMAYLWFWHRQNGILTLKMHIIKENKIDNTAKSSKSD